MTIALKNGENDSTSENDDKNSEDNIPLNVDILIPKDLVNEISSKLEDEIKDADVVRIHYQLKTLEYGTVQIFYKQDDVKIYSVEVDIASKEITEYKKIEDEDLAQKSAIEDNLNEDIKQDFEKYKDRLIEENNRLNIMISYTEIMINVSYV